VTDPDDLLTAAIRILDGAQCDLERGFWESACISAQRGAVIATEAWLRSSGQSHVSGSVRENVGFLPGLDVEIRKAAEKLDRYRREEAFPHRSSFSGVEPKLDAPGVVEAGRIVVRFVERQLT
jgi:HEPN domain-containing protein